MYFFKVPSLFNLSVYLMFEYINYVFILTKKLVKPS